MTARAQARVAGLPVQPGGVTHLGMAAAETTVERTLISLKGPAPEVEAWERAATSAGMTRAVWCKAILNAAADHEGTPSRAWRRTGPAAPTGHGSDERVSVSLRATQDELDAWDRAAEAAGELPRQLWCKLILNAAAERSTLPRQMLLASGAAARLRTTGTRERTGSRLKHRKNAPKRERAPARRRSRRR